MHIERLMKCKLCFVNISLFIKSSVLQICCDLVTLTTFQKANCWTRLTNACLCTRTLDKERCKELVKFTSLETTPHLQKKAGNHNHNPKAGENSAASAFVPQPKSGYSTKALANLGMKVSIAILTASACA